MSKSGKITKKKILFVDDEPSIRLTLPAILTMHGFEVVSAGTISEALSAMQSQNFDVLISDLNIGQPGDGFTVVSAMRRLQPHSITFIITGFPAFETAMQAIRAQVDDYLVKPADINTLVSSIEEKLTNRKPHHAILPKPVGVILEENGEQICQEWLQAVKADHEISSIKISDRERTDHIPGLLKEIMKGLKTNAPHRRPEELKTAAAHGKTRRKQDYTIPMLLEEACILRHVICDFLQRNLLAVEISSLIPDMIKIDDNLDRSISESVRAYLGQNLTPQNSANSKSLRSRKIA